MRKVDLSMNEEFKYQTIKKLVDSNGNKKRAAIQLSCTARTINRLIQRYHQYGKAGFLHGNRGNVPACSFDITFKQKIVDLYESDYADTNFRHFSELVYEDFGVKISDTTLNRWLREDLIISPKAHRSTKKKITDTLKLIQKQATSQATHNQCLQTLHQIDDRQAHPRRPRSKYRGEMVQMDASSFEWINGQVWYIHLAIDDASGEVLGAYFDTQETLNGYYHVLHQILTNYGIPAMIYVDRRTVFEYKRKNTLLDHEDTFTQFSYACHQLGIEIKTTSIPQAKGRVERLNQTFQSRVPVELRRKHVSTLIDANQFLESYLTKFNQQFALRLNRSKSVFETQPSASTINQVLAILSHRIIDAGHCIKFKNHFYLPHNSQGEPAYFLRKTECLIIQAFDAHLYASIDDQIYTLQKVERHERFSSQFDSNIPKKKPFKPHVPPMSHPWKRESFLRFQESMKHRQSGANV